MYSPYFFFSLVIFDRQTGNIVIIKTDEIIYFPALTSTYTLQKIPPNCTKTQDIELNLKSPPVSS